MTLVCTLAMTCDGCGSLISHKSHALEGALMLPEPPTVLGLHLCKSCGELAAEAVRTALEPIQLAQKGRRSS